VVEEEQASLDHEVGSSLLYSGWLSSEDDYVINFEDDKDVATMPEYESPQLDGRRRLSGVVRRGRRRTRGGTSRTCIGTT
jgi:hypothetical protein